MSTEIVGFNEQPWEGVVSAAHAVALVRDFDNESPYGYDHLGRRINPIQECKIKGQVIPGVYQIQGQVDLSQLDQNGMPTTDDEFRKLSQNEAFYVGRPPYIIYPGQTGYQVRLRGRGLERPIPEGFKEIVLGGVQRLVVPGSEEERVLVDLTSKWQEGNTQIDYWNLYGVVDKASGLLTHASTRLVLRLAPQHSTDQPFDGIEDILGRYDDDGSGRPPVVVDQSQWSNQ